MKLDNRQLASVLAGLRLLQVVVENDAIRAGSRIDQVRTDCETLEPLTAEEIDQLAEEINQ